MWISSHIKEEYFYKFIPIYIVFLFKCSNELIFEESDYEK